MICLESWYFWDCLSFGHDYIVFCGFSRVFISYINNGSFGRENWKLVATWILVVECAQSGSSLIVSKGICNLDCYLWWIWEKTPGKGLESRTILTNTHWMQGSRIEYKPQLQTASALSTAPSLPFSPSPPTESHNDPVEYVMRWYGEKGAPVYYI